jgi:protein-S-isoprenylcysteine O-methyltransferase Ste14
MTDRPGVLIPPPLLFGVGWALGAWLRHYTGYGVMDAFWSPFVGWPLVGAALVLGIWGVVTLRRHRTGIMPHRPSTAVVEDGPYRFTRNPLYLAMTLGYLGTALAFGQWWAVALLPLVLLALHPLVIVREERYLQDKFGETYGAYRARVPRWI